MLIICHNKELFFCQWHFFINFAKKQPYNFVHYFTPKFNKPIAKI